MQVVIKIGLKTIKLPKEKHAILQKNRIGQWEEQFRIKKNS